jgi:hypothetical protein
MLICEKIEIAVDLVDCLEKLGSDRLGIVEGQGRGQQFHAGEAVFRPVQWVQPVLGDDIEARALWRPGWGRPGAPGPLAQFCREDSAEGRRSLVHGVSMAQLSLETGLAKVAEDDFQLEAGTPGWYRGHGREGN